MSGEGQLEVLSDYQDVERQFRLDECLVEVAFGPGHTGGWIQRGTKLTCHPHPQSSMRRRIALRRDVTAVSSPGMNGSDTFTSSTNALELKMRFSTALM